MASVSCTVRCLLTGEAAKYGSDRHAKSGEIAFAALYAEQMQTVKEIGQLSSGDPSATADSAASSSADDLLALLQLQAGWNSNACEAENPLNVPGEANGQPGDIPFVVMRKRPEVELQSTWPPAAVTFRSSCSR